MSKKPEFFDLYLEESAKYPTALPFYVVDDIIINTELDIDKNFIDYAAERFNGEIIANLVICVLERCRRICWELVPFVNRCFFREIIIRAILHDLDAVELIEKLTDDEFYEPYFLQMYLGLNDKFNANINNKPFFVCALVYSHNIKTEKELSPRIIGTFDENGIIVTDFPGYNETETPREYSAIFLTNLGLNIVSEIAIVKNSTIHAKILNEVFNYLHYAQFDGNYDWRAGYFVTTDMNEIFANMSATLTREEYSELLEIIYRLCVRLTIKNAFNNNYEFDSRNYFEKSDIIDNFMTYENYRIAVAEIYGDAYYELKRPKIAKMLELPEEEEIY